MRRLKFHIDARYLLRSFFFHVPKLSFFSIIVNLLPIVIYVATNLNSDGDELAFRARFDNASTMGSLLIWLSTN